MQPIRPLEGQTALAPAMQEVETKTSTEQVIEDWIDDSPYGGGKVIVRLVVTKDEPVVDLTLTWVPECTEDQPDRWEVFYWHHVDMIFDSLEEYLGKYCPVPEAVWTAINKLDLSKIAVQD
jgi:hypothetical protein